MTENTENEAQKRAHLIHKDAIILFFFHLLRLLYSRGKAGQKYEKNHHDVKQRSH